MDGKWRINFVQRCSRHVLSRQCPLSSIWWAFCAIALLNRNVTKDNRRLATMTELLLGCLISFIHFLSLSLSHSLPVIVITLLQENNENSLNQEINTKQWCGCGWNYNKHNWLRIHWGRRADLFLFATWLHYKLLIYLYQFLPSHASRDEIYDH